MTPIEPRTQSMGTGPAGDKRPQGPSPINVPNIITLSRLVLAVILFAMIDYGQWWLWSTALFIVAATTDALDGYIARRYGLVTVLGRILDPFVDKVIICGAFIFLLGYSGSGINAWMTIVVIGREMFVTSLRSFLEQQGKDFSAAWSGKIKMALQCTAVAASLMSLSTAFGPESAYGEQFRILRDVLLWSAVAATIYSGYSYIVRAIQLFRQPASPG